MSHKEKLLGLLEYTHRLAQFTQKANFTTKAYKTLLYTEQQLHNRVGIHHNVSEEDGIAWLKIERLQRREPPTPGEDIAAWIDLSSDPHKQPVIHDSILSRISESEAKQLIEAGTLKSDDVLGPLESASETEDVDVRLVLKNHPDIKRLIDGYLAGPWQTWKSAEIPKLQTIAIYEKFFRLCQEIESSGSETSLEVIWGLGFALWRENRQTLEHPVIEAPVEVRIEKQTQAIVVTPRERDPQFYLSPFSEMGLETVKTTQERMRETLEETLADEGQDGANDITEFSPFVPNSFRPTLELAAGLLTSDGRYWPNVNEDIENRSHPKISNTLTITDSWAIYARPRGSNIFVEDINRLKREIEKTPVGNLPPVGERIVRDPDAPSTGTGSTGVPTMSSDGNQVQLLDESEILFPKPYNNAQIRIVKRLQCEDGVVVQGPPGTGKTHTIANIVCHYLATGRSVLVVSKGEPALSVLRDQIPEEIRNLTISLLTSERDGYKQLEGAVTFMANEVMAQNEENLERNICHAQQRIDELRKELVSVDNRMLQLAEVQLTKIPADLEIDGKNWPWEAACVLSESKSQYAWLDDQLGYDESFTPQFSDGEIKLLRDARARLKDDIVYAGTRIPERNDLPTSREIGIAHANLVQAESLSEQPAANSIPPIVVQDEQTRASAVRLAEALDSMRQALDCCADEKWIADLYQCWIVNGVAVDNDATVENAVNDLGGLCDQRGTFRKRPIALPQQVIDEVGLIQALQRGKRSGKPFGAFAIGGKEIKSYLQQTRIAGQPAVTADDWGYVLDYVEFRKSMVAFAYRWNALAEDFDVPEVDVDASQMEKWIGQAGKPIVAALNAAINFHESVASDTDRLFSAMIDPKEMAFKSNTIEEIQSSLKIYLHQQELGESRFSIEKVSAELSGRKGPVFDSCRQFLDADMGNPERQSDWVERCWAEFLAEFDRLRGLQNDFATLVKFVRKIADSGAKRWASRLLSIPVNTTRDSELPDNWSTAWRFRRLEAYLTSIDARSELSELSAKRISTQVSLERATQELVKSRTYLGLLARMRIGGRAAALRQFLSAIRNIGKGTGKRATRYRGDAQKAMAKCMEAVPCWIMPTWRVSESLPPTLGAFDLVIIDEASQSDIMALPAILRGRKVLVVGDDRQVSPSAVGLEEKKLKQLRHGYLKGQPFSDLLMPGTSFYELAQAVFPSSSIMLNEHFRCVEPIIRFSLQFYPEKFVPLRIPKPSERLDPPLIDVYIKNAKRKGMVNEAEAVAIVDEIERLVNDPTYDERTIGVVALLGNKQSKLIQDRLLERIGEDKFQKHKITCGDPPTFQGKERDIIFLSMVAVPKNAAAQMSRQFQQRYNVALSRARDRMYLYRSVTETDLRNENDLKQKVINHFQAPMPAMAEQITDLIELCDSGFEREVFRRLVELDYRVTPQVAVGEYKIDLVVDGGDDRRLAIELDGDQYHGPDRWFDDYARQKTLERMNWKFWRCWGSSFARDPEDCMANLIETLEGQGIKPIGRSKGVQPFTEGRVLDANQILGDKEVDDVVNTAMPDDFADASNVAGDSITIVFDDEPNRLYQLVLVEGESDLRDGEVSIHDETGKQLLNSQTDDEFDLIWNSKKRLCVVRSIEKADSVTVS